MQSIRLQFLRIARRNDSSVQSYGTQNEESHPDQLELSNQDQKQVKSKRHHFIGIFLAILTGLFFTAISFLVKYLKNKTGSDLSLIVGLGSAIFALPVFINSRNKTRLDLKFFGLAFLLGIFAAVSTTTRYTALKMLPIGEASAIIFSSPLFTAIFARIILKDKISRITLVSLLVSLIGILLVAKVPELFHQVVEDAHQHLIGCVYAFVAVISVSLINITGRKLRYANRWIVTFIQAVLCSIVTASISPMFDGLTLFRSDCSYESWIFVCVGLCGFGVGVLMIASLKYEDPVVVSSIMLSSDIVSSFLFQLLFFHEPMDAYSGSGATLIFVASLVLPFRKWILSLPEESRTRQRFKCMEK